MEGWGRDLWALSHSSGMRHSGVLQKRITADNCIDQKATRKNFECFHHNKRMNVFKFPFFEDIEKMTNLWSC